jgi:hypothetical protein
LTTLTKNEKDHIAQALIDLEICKSENAIMESSLFKIQGLVDRENAWYYQPEIVVSGLVISFGLGAVVAPLLIHH